MLCRWGIVKNSLDFPTGWIPSSAATGRLSHHTGALPAILLTEMYGSSFVHRHGLLFCGISLSEAILPEYDVFIQKIIFPYGHEYGDRS